METLKLSLPTHLTQTLPSKYQGDEQPLSFNARRWSGIVEEMRERYPELASRVLTDTGEVAGGFALVVNDQVIARSKVQSLELEPNDELFLIATIAGG